MKTIKVTKVQKHKTTQSGEVDVVKGKLIIPMRDNNDDYKGWLKPIIISDTEDIESGDKYYYRHFGEDNIVDVNESLQKQLNTLENLNNLGGGRYNRFYSKIIALTENFSPKQLQAIVDGKMKDGDDVLVECEICDGELNFDGGGLVGRFYKCSKCNDGSEYGIAKLKCKKSIIKLNKDNHITLFPIKQDKIYSRNELRYEISCTVAYMMAHPKINAAEMKENQDKLDKWIDEYVK